MKHRILCYREEKLKLTIEVHINYFEFIRQLKEGFIFYDTGLGTGNTEIVNLRQFDKIVVCNELLFDVLKGSDYHD